MARDIAQDATWRNFTDPASGEFLGISCDSYRPGADLTRTVVAREGTCRFIG